MRGKFRSVISHSIDEFRVYGLLNELLTLMFHFDFSKWRFTKSTMKANETEREKKSWKKTIIERDSIQTNRYSVSRRMICSSDNQIYPSHEEISPKKESLQLFFFLRRTKNGNVEQRNRKINQQRTKCTYFLCVRYVLEFAGEPKIHITHFCGFCLCFITSPKRRVEAQIWTSKKNALK